jgi:hypothetical protein
MIFKEQTLQTVFNRDGFTVVPFLQKDELYELRLLYESVVKGSVSGLFPSHSHGSLEQNMNVHQSISAIIQEATSRLFQNYDFVANHFMVKGKSTVDEFRLHQDWNIVEEDKFDAVHIWCPLLDTNELNGGMFAVKGSHHFFKNVRSGSLGIPFIDTTTVVRNHLSAFNVKAGYALLYKQSTFHGSFSNNSNEDRAVALCTIKQRDADIVYYQKQDDFAENKMVDVYRLNTELLLGQLTALEKGEKPEGAELIKSFEYCSIENNFITAEVFEKNLLAVEYAGT